MAVHPLSVSQGFAQFCTGKPFTSVGTVRVLPVAVVVVAAVCVSAAPAGIAATIMDRSIATINKIDSVFFIIFSSLYIKI
jgi:hypothetical protein